MGAKDFVLKNFLILGLLTVITLGLLFPGPGLAFGQVTVHGLTVPDIAIDIIFVVSGLCLDSVADALQPKALILGTILVLCVTPLMSIPITMLATSDPSLNKTLLQGMALFTVVPTTLSSGVTMVTQAKGNVSLAILLTTLTNIMGVFIMPWSASMVFATTVPVSPWDLLDQLIWLTLIPLIIGMSMRRLIAPLGRFAKSYKKPLGLSQNSCILVVVWLMISKAEGEIAITSNKDLMLCAGLAGGVHLVYRIIGYVVATAARLPPREWVTIVLMCSQKSLPVCVSVLSALPLSMQVNTGLQILPCIMAHAAQLIIDSILAVRWEVQADAASNAVKAREPVLNEPLLGKV